MGVRERDMVKEPLGWFSFLRHRHGVGLFKKNVAAAVVVCFFIDRTWRISSAKVNLFALSYVYVHSNAIRYFHLHNFCGGGWMREGGVSDFLRNISGAQWRPCHHHPRDADGVVFSRSPAISAHSLGELCMFRWSLSCLEQLPLTSSVKWILTRVCSRSMYSSMLV